MRITLGNALGDVPRDLDGQPHKRFAVGSGDFDAARKATGSHPVSKGSAVIAEPQRFKLVVSKIPSAEVPAAKKLRDQRVVEVEL
jgi:hypothetical protein